MLPNTIETIIVRPGEYDEEMMVKIEDYPNLQEILFFSDTFKNASHLQIQNCPCLTSLQIEDGCFMGEKSSFVLMDCSELFSLIIGDSFGHLESCALASKQVDSFT